MTAFNGPDYDDTPLHVPEITRDMTAMQAALALARAGWFVGPVAHRSKNPGSILGAQWHSRTTRDPQVIASWYAGDSTGLGVFLHVGRSGAVAFDVDHPEHLPQVLRDAFNAIPRPPIATTRRRVEGEPIKGHVLFVQPPLRKIGNSTGGLGRDWGEVRGVNGVIIVAPSTHEDEDEDGYYDWLFTGPVPVLPDSIAALLPDSGDTADPASSAEVRKALAEWTGNDNPGAFVPLQNEWVRRMGDGASRHDSARDLACWAAREARAGLYPLGETLAWLRDEFVSVMTVPVGKRVLTAGQAKAEFADLASWAIGQAIAESPERIERCRQRGLKGLRSLDDDRGDLEAAFQASDAEQTTHTPLGGDDAAIDKLWTETPILEHIAAAAEAAQCSPWGLLLTILVRVTASVPPTVRAPAEHPGGAGGSLNLFGAVVAPAGGGKGRTDRTARELLPEAGGGAAFDSDERAPFAHPGGDGVPVGTGEGLARVFVDRVQNGKGKDTRPELRQHSDRALAVVTEIQELQAKGAGRQGATLLQTLRSAWVGEQFGSTTADLDRRVVVRPHTYRLGLLVHAQPAVTGWLLADEAGGTPQRFAWAEGVRRGATVERGPWPGALPYERANAALAGAHGHPHTMGLPPEARRWLAELDTAKQRAATGEELGPELEQWNGSPYVDDPLYCHAGFGRVKIAAALALLHGRGDVSSLDWSMSEMVVEHSGRTLAGIRATLSREARRAQARLGRGDAVREMVRDGHRDELDGIAKGQARDSILRTLERKNGVCTAKGVRESLKSGAVRKQFVAALDDLVQEGRITAAEEPTETGPSRVLRLAGRALT